MKKIMLGLITTIIMLVVATTVVNAASVSATPASVEKGKTVTVTVNYTEATRNVDIKLNYDTTKFDYVADSASCDFDLAEDVVTSDTTGTVSVSGSNAKKSTKAVSFTFTAKETVGEANFEVDADSFVNELDETLTTATTKVTITETKPQENPPTDDQEEPSKEPTKDNEEDKTPSKDKENNKKPASDKETSKKPASNEDKVDSNGNKITELPKTGVSYLVFVIAGIAIVGATIVVAKKLK